MKIFITLLFAAAIGTFSATSYSSGGRYTDAYLDKMRLGCESDIYAFGSYVSFASTMAKRDRGESDRMAAATLDSEGYHPCIIRSVLKTVVGMHRNTFTPPQAVQKRFNELKKKYAKKLEARFDPDYYDKINSEKTRQKVQAIMKKHEARRKAEEEEEAASTERKERFFKWLANVGSEISNSWSNVLTFFSDS